MSALHLSSTPTFSWGGLSLVRIIVSPSTFLSNYHPGFILYMISRECVYYINLRQAYLLSPRYAHRLSSRTVLFSCVPDRYLDERRIRKLFGDSVKRVWIPKNTKVLRQLVKEREETAMRLEKAEITLIRIANDARNKQLRTPLRSLLKSYAKGFSHSSPVEPAEVEACSPSTKVMDEEKGKTTDDIHVVEQQRSRPNSIPSSSSRPKVSDKEGDAEYIHPYGLDPSLPDVNGSVAALWVPASARPSHRPLANYLRRVDTIKWTRSRIKVLNVQIAKLRRQHRAGRGSSMNAVFVEFDSLANAQAAYQILAHHQPLHMSPRFIGIRPHEIVWSALRMKWWERIIRRFLVMGTIAAAIIFWSIPATFVGIASNVKFLATNIPFLSWIQDLPATIVNVVQGLLPALALSLLMAIVPMLLRGECKCFPLLTRGS
jgi:calcium permeable stress-gated cation channel